MSVSGRGTISVVSRKRFFSTIVTHLRTSLPPDLARFTHRGDFNLMKVWWDNPRVHFEVAIHQHIDRIEVGLHLEDGPVSTVAYLRILDGRILELKHTLGHEAELERWTASWGRLYELHPFDDLDGAVTRRAAERLEAFIEALQPLIAGAGVPAERSAVG